MTQADHQTSTGHALASATWVDTHFDISKAAFREIVSMVGFAPGGHVLDAGSGGGSYLALLAEQVGPDGRLTALDIDPGNIALIEQRITREPPGTAADAVEGSIFDLPFPDDTFDGVWCANVTQYLSDDELTRTIEEFKRVTSPGGLIAFKDYSNDVSTIRPIPFGYLERLIEGKLQEGDTQWRGGCRTWNLRSFLGRAGLEDIRQKTVVIDHFGPLGPAARAFHGGYISYYAGLALDLDLPNDEHEFWRQQLDPTSPEAIVNRDDFYSAEGQILAVGRAPEEGRARR